MAAEAAVFSNAPDSRGLITVAGKRDALLAVATICDQGEGAQHRRSDDPSHREDSHYFKFLKLQARSTLETLAILLEDTQ